jgi:hypothetical protein
MTWKREMKRAAKELVRVCACRLSGWDSRDPVLLCLHTLEDIARNCSQWRVFSISDFLVLFSHRTFALGFPFFS